MTNADISRILTCDVTFGYNAAGPHLNHYKICLNQKTPYLVVEHILTTILTSEKLVKARVVMDMFKTFIRSAESRRSAINKSSKCERCFIL